MKSDLIALAKKFKKIAEGDDFPTEFKMHSLMRPPAPKEDEFSFTSLINPPSSGDYELSGEGLDGEKIRSIKDGGPSEIKGKIIEMHSVLSAIEKAYAAGDYDAAEDLLNSMAEKTATIAARIDLRK